MDSFILYTDQKEVVRKLTDEQAGQLLKGLYDYAETETIPELDNVIDLVITPFITTIMRDKQKYDRRCETSAINGKLGGRPKKPNKNLTKPKKADSDSVSDSDNDSDSNKKEIITKKKFIKPTLEEVKAYCLERKNKVDAQRFIDYYEANGWKVGRNSMKDWKAAIRTWERNDGSFSNKQSKTNDKQDLPNWFDRNVENKQITEIEENELSKILEELEVSCDTK